MCFRSCHCITLLCCFFVVGLRISCIAFPVQHGTQSPLHYFTPLSFLCCRLTHFVHCVSCSVWNAIDDTSSVCFHRICSKASSTSVTTTGISSLTSVWSKRLTTFR